MKLYQLKHTAIGVFLLFLIQVAYAQNFVRNNPFPDHFFIENKGQFPNFQGKPVLFELTDKSDKIYILKDGFLWTKGYKDSSTKENEIKIAWIRNQFIGSNANTHVKTIGKTKHYFTHGLLSSKSFGYEKVILENFYPKIDLIFEFGQKGAGIKYSFKVHSGGNIQDIQFTYTSNDSLSLKNHETKIEVQNPLFNLVEGNLDVFNAQNKIEATYKIENQTIKYNIPSFKIGQSIVIDPWVKSINNFLRLTNLYSESFGENIGFDVDFDSKGNVYVFGGCPIGLNQLHIAKYDLSGNLKWIFDGVIYIPNHGITWYSTRVSNTMGTFAVDRATDKLYLSEAFGWAGVGNLIIRLDSNGQSDSFMIHHRGFTMCSKMLVRCDPHRVVALGGFPHTGYWNQLFELVDTNIYKPKSFIPDIAKGSKVPFVVDAAWDDSNRIFALYKSFSPPNGGYFTSPNNVDVIAKLTDSMTGTVWRDSLQTNLKATTIKPYVPSSMTTAGTSIGFSTNSLSVTKNFVYYYDGKFISAHNKFSGNLVKLDSIPGKIQSFQQGIVADNCGNIVVGSDSGRLKLFQFNGSTFNFIKNIIVFPNSARCVLDLMYDKDRNVLVFSGDSMVGTISNPANCEASKTTEFYVYPNKRCSNFAFAQIKYPDTTKSYTFIWYDSTSNKISRKITKFKQFRDTFINRNPSHSYLVTIKKEDACYSLVSSFWLYAIPEYDTTFKINLCEGSSFQHKNKNYTGTQTIVDTFKTYFGCDSFVRYQITSFKHSSLNQNKFICRGDTLWIGRYFHTQTGNFHDTFVNSNGCDSIVHTVLKVFHDSIYQFVRICNGTSFKVGNSHYIKSGLYVDSFKNYWGCDSVVRTKLIIDRDTVIQKKYNICDGDLIIVGQNSYKNTGTYYDTFKRISGCDSVVISEIKAYSDTVIQQMKNICQGDTLKIGNNIYTESDVYHDTLMRHTGCDSVIITQLKVFMTYDTIQKIILCKEDSILINGKYYSSNTKFNEVYRNTNGCDSTVTYFIQKNILDADFEIDTTKNPYFIFKNLTQGGYKYYWNFGDFSIDSVNKNTSHQYNNDKSYWVNVCLTVIDSFGCNDTICKKIEISKLMYYLFNSFTPGNDGQNDVLKIKYRGGNFNYNLMVYNRWGALVYETQNASVTDEAQFWNGRVMNSGAECPAGSYFALYQLYLNGPNSAPKQIHGVITLIR